MDLNLSKAERDKLRRDLCAAEPYDYDDPILNTLDKGGPELDRWGATMAKKLLEQDEEEKAARGLPLEPVSTPESERRRIAEESKGRRLKGSEPS